jgi:hypothetical protein
MGLSLIIGTVMLATTLTQSIYKTPDVYVEEISLSPPSVAEVETAVPAFIGHTDRRRAAERRLRPHIAQDAGRIISGPAPDLPERPAPPSRESSRFAASPTPH